MTRPASARPANRSDNRGSSVTIEKASSGDKFDGCTIVAAGKRAKKAAPALPEDRKPNYSEWRFGDLTLSREVCRSGQQALSLHRSWQARSQGCVILHVGNGASAPTLVVSSRASLAMAALERHAHRSGVDGEVLMLFMPMEAWEGGDPEAASSVRHLDTASGHGALLAAFMQHLASQSGHIDSHRAKPLAAATRMLVAACTTTSGEYIAPMLPSPASGIVERARLMVQRQMASSDFGPPQLARLLAMSRSKLYRLLDGEGGVAHFINRERLMRAWRDLTAPGEALSVHAIAYQVGFRDHSTFSRAFRREFGCSPREARERAHFTPADAACEPLSECGESASIGPCPTCLTGGRMG